MTRVGANDIDAAFSADDLTVFANSFDAGADFHLISSFDFLKFKAHQYTSVAGIPQGPNLKVFKENRLRSLQAVFLGLHRFKGVANGTKA